MEKLLETHNLLKLKQEESENLNRWITTNEIERAIKKLPTNKSPGPDGFTGELLPNIQRTNTYPFQTIPKSSRGGKTPKLFL